MHGIPGFAGKADAAGWETPAAFERITPEDALAIGRDVFGLDVRTVARLETERDDTFRLRTAGRDLVLKVAHPADSAVSIDLQTRALQFAQARDAELPLQRFIETPQGEIAPMLATHHERIARVLTWLPGTLLEDATPDDDQLAALGESLGRLSTALRGFEHAASDYPMAWDLAQAHKLRVVAELFPDPVVAEALDRFDRLVQPIRDELPRQVIHNDFNPGNVVVDPHGPVYVTGILDFGDVIHSLRIADLAVALSYQLFPLGRSWGECAAFIEGFERKILLLPIERAVLKTLVATRFAQRILVGDWLAREGTGRPAARYHREGARAALDELL